MNHSPQQQQTNSRVKRNWGKVRQLFMKDKSKLKGPLLQSNNQAKKFLCSNSKNNLYNLFDKSVQLLSKQNQNLIETQYRFKIQLPKTMSPSQQSHNLTFTTFTPLPSKENILKATSNKNYNLSTQIDTTGFWVWEAEEIMAYFIIKEYQSLSTILSKQRQIFIDFYHLNTVLQLGAGSSGLASVVLAQIIYLQTPTFPTNSNTFIPSSLSVNITDGKVQNIQYLNKNIHYNFNTQNKNNSGQQNCINKSQISITAEFMIWGTQTNNKYDLILAADCLFFQQYHPQLINTLQFSMHQSSVALFVNPRRGKSMERFILLAQEYFQISSIDFDDEKYKSQEEKIKKRLDFDPEKDLFNFLLLRRKSLQILEHDQKQRGKANI